MCIRDRLSIECEYLNVRNFFSSDLNQTINDKIRITESTLSNTVESSSSFYEEKGLNVSLCCGDGPNDEIMSICFLVP